MENKYYPFIFNLDSKKLLFVGGGRVAERKILLLYKLARISVVSPEVTTEIEKLYVNGEIEINYKIFEADDIKSDSTFVFACTNNINLNKKIGYLCHKMGIFVYVAGDKNLSDFSMPAVFKSEQYLIALSTYGKSPTIAKKIRNYLKGILTNIKFIL